MKKFLIFAFLLILSIGFFVYNKRDVGVDVSENTEELSTVTEEVENQVEEEEAVSTDTWHLYETDFYSIKYPDGFEPAQYSKLTTFQPRDFEDGAFYWVVNVVPNRENTVENLITGMGAQYSKDRFVDRSELKIGDIDALKVVVTTELAPDFYYEAIFAETEKNVFFITNAQEANAKFTAFYKTFRLE